MSETYTPEMTVVDFRFTRASFLPLPSTVDPVDSPQVVPSLRILPEETTLPETVRRWKDSAAAWVKSRSEEEITKEWRDRMVWDIGRTPVLLERVGVSPVPPPSQVTAEHVVALKHGLGWQPRTMASYFSALRPFLRSVGNRVADVRSLWSLPSGESTHRRWLSLEELCALYASARGAERVIVALEGYNGLRRIECRRLRIRDVDFVGGRLHVLGKGRNGGKWRIVLMTETVRTVLADWTAGRGPDEYILPGQEAKMAGKPLSEHACDCLISRAAHRAGIGKRVSGHDLRRTFGREAYRAGMDLLDLRALYGHKDLGMTTYYIGVQEDSQRRGLEKFERATSQYPVSSGVRG
jgi:integrase